MKYYFKQHFIGGDISIKTTLKAHRTANDSAADEKTCIFTRQANQCPNRMQASKQALTIFHLQA